MMIDLEARGDNVSALGTDGSSPSGNASGESVIN